MKKVFLLFTLIFAFYSASLMAGVTEFSKDEAAGSAVVDVQFNEPAFEWDPVTGTPTTVPLTDLSHHTIFIRVNGGTWTPVTEPASSASGGMLISRKITMPIPNASNTIEAYVISEDLTGNEAPPSVTGSVVITRDVIPPEPADLF